jgi:TldD protein
VYRREFLRLCGLSVPAFLLAPGCRTPSRAGSLSPEDPREGLADLALRAARRSGASYADVRICAYRHRDVRVRDRRVSRLSDSSSEGFGVRVLADGAWGFASSPRLEPAEVERVAALAVEVARASSRARPSRVELTPVEAFRDAYETPHEKDPFEVPLDAMVDLLLRVSERALAVPGAKLVTSSLSFAREDKLFASTEGSRIRQRILRCAPGTTVTAVGSGTSKSRSAFVPPLNAGYEHVEAARMVETAEGIAREAVEALAAAPPPAGRYDLVLDPSHLHLTIHESIAHPTELDRALGWEADYAGTTFATPEKLGRLRYGSKHVNVTADRTLPHGRSTCGYDDDGVKTIEWPIVRDGTFVGYQTTRETAPYLGQRTSTACSYADSWNSVPFLRIPNLHLDPGPDSVTPEDLLRSVQRGILIRGRGSYSIDHQRYHFQFGGDASWLIEDGKPTRRLRDLVYAANTLDFWNACDGVAGRAFWEPQGIVNDGKGQPNQAGQQTHGCSWALFRGIEVSPAG